MLSREKVEEENVRGKDFVEVVDDLEESETMLVKTQIVTNTLIVRQFCTQVAKF